MRGSHGNERPDQDTAVHLDAADDAHPSPGRPRATAPAQDSRLRIALALTSYSALVFAPVGFFLRVVFLLVLVVVVVAIATGIMHGGNQGAFSG